MAKKRTVPRLAAGEMEIMQVLWSCGGVTISEAQRALDRPVGYTTVQTRLNRLVDKGVVRRTKSRPGKYLAVVAPEEVSARHLELLLERVSSGNVVPLVAHLVRDRDLSLEAIAELRQLVDEAERHSRQNEANEAEP